MNEVALYDMFSNVKHQARIMLMPFGVELCQGVRTFTMKLDPTVGNSIGSIVALLIHSRGNSLSDVFFGGMSFDPGQFN